jgi:TRAP-type C4-dicarboxylate transport system permease small subunit
MERAWNTWRWITDNILGLIATIPTIAGVALAVAEVIRRYGFGVTYIWSTDAVTYFILSGVFLYFGVTQLRRSHLTVDLLYVTLERQGARPRIIHFFKALSTVLTFLFLSGLLFFGLPALMRVIEGGRRTTSLVFPLWPFQAALYVGLVIMMITVIFQLYNDLRALFVGQPAWEETEVQEEL